jgi:hypothetical protein
MSIKKNHLFFCYAIYVLVPAFYNVISPNIINSKNLKYTTCQKYYRFFNIFTFATLTYTLLAAHIIIITRDIATCLFFLTLVYSPSHIHTYRAKLC